MTDPTTPATTVATPPGPGAAHVHAPDTQALGGEPEDIEAAIRASQQRLSDAVEDVTTAVNPVNVAHRSADAIREDPRPVLAVAGALVAFAILVAILRRVRSGGPGTA
jgi:hypothetical protein